MLQLYYSFCDWLSSHLKKQKELKRRRKYQEHVSRMKRQTVPLPNRICMFISIDIELDLASKILTFSRIIVK